MLQLLLLLGLEFVPAAAVAAAAGQVHAAAVAWQACKERSSNMLMDSNHQHLNQHTPVQIDT